MRIIAGSIYQEFLADTAYWAAGESGHKISAEGVILLIDSQEFAGDAITPASIGPGSAVTIVAGDVFEGFDRLHSLQDHFDSWLQAQQPPGANMMLITHALCTAKTATVCVLELKVGDIAHFHGARFEIIQADVRPDSRDGVDVMHAYGKWIDGKAVPHYFGPDKNWKFQGNARAKAVIEVSDSTEFQHIRIGGKFIDAGGFTYEKISADKARHYHTAYKVGHLDYEFVADAPAHARL